MPSYEVKQIMNEPDMWVGACLVCDYTTNRLSNKEIVERAIQKHVVIHSPHQHEVGLEGMGTSLHPDEQETFIARPTIIAHPCDHSPRCETPHRRDFMTRPKHTICAGCTTEGATVEGAWVSVRADFLVGVSVPYHAEVGTGRLMVFLCGAECLFKLSLGIFLAAIKRKMRA